MSKKTDLRAELDRATAAMARAESRLEQAVFDLEIMTAERNQLEREQLRPSKPFRPDMKRVDAGDWTRASQYSVCTCGYQYWEHATVQGLQWIHRLCDGRLVKL